MPRLARQCIDAELAQRGIVDDVDALKVNFITLAGEPDQQQISAEVIKVSSDELDRLALGLGLLLGLAFGFLLRLLLLGFCLLLFGELRCRLAPGVFLELLLAFGLGRRLLSLCALLAQRRRL